jgi:tRNA A37 threonylcarbamoyladenosine synthetase subunit TsaC/SUA5/YrdC
MGIGCDATNPEAVTNLQAQKRETQSMIVLMNGERNVQRL